MTHLQGQAVTSLTPWPNKNPMVLHIIRNYLPAYMALTSHKSGPLWEPQISHNTYSGPPILTSVSTSWFWHVQEIIHTKYSGWRVFTATDIREMQLVAYASMLQDAVAAHTKTVLHLSHGE